MMIIHQSILAVAITPLTPTPPPTSAYLISPTALGQGNYIVFLVPDLWTQKTEVNLRSGEKIPLSFNSGAV